MEIDVKSDQAESVFANDLTSVISNAINNDVQLKADEGSEKSKISYPVQTEDLNFVVDQLLSQIPGVSEASPNTTTKSNSSSPVEKEISTLDSCNNNSVSDLTQSGNELNVASVKNLPQNDLSNDESCFTPINVKNVLTASESDVSKKVENIVIENKVINPIEGVDVKSNQSKSSVFESSLLTSPTNKINSTNNSESKENREQNIIQIDNDENTKQEATIDSSCSNKNDFTNLKPGNQVSNNQNKGKTKSNTIVNNCLVCHKFSKCKYNIVRDGDTKHLCDDICFNKFRSNPVSFLKSTEASSNTGKSPSPKSCSNCNKKASEPNSVTFQERLFCSQACKMKFTKRRRKCAFCETLINEFSEGFVKKNPVGNALDYCSDTCFQHHSYNVKVASSALKSAETLVAGKRCSVERASEPSVAAKRLPVERVLGFAASVSPSSEVCTVCFKKRPIKHRLAIEDKIQNICSTSCLSSFQSANKLVHTTCYQCMKKIYIRSTPNPLSIKFEGKSCSFCSSVCLSLFKRKRNKMTPCTWCSTKCKYFDMIERIGDDFKPGMFCSLNCLSLYRVNQQATSSQSIMCDQCKSKSPAQYHLTMSDASVRNFCSYGCVMNFQNQFTAPQAVISANSAAPNLGSSVPSVGVENCINIVPSRTESPAVPITPLNNNQSGVPMISSVMSLAPPDSNSNSTQIPTSNSDPRRVSLNVTVEQTPESQAVLQKQVVQKQVIIQKAEPKPCRNKSITCKPVVQTKATSCRPLHNSAETQTDSDSWNGKVIFPVPVPIFIPVPIMMYSQPVPYPVPIPIPIPVPQFIPTSRKTTAGVAKQIKKIVDNVPSDPYEAELLMIAKAVEKAEDSSDSGSSTDDDEDKNEPVTNAKDNEEALTSAEPINEVPQYVINAPELGDPFSAAAAVVAAAGGDANIAEENVLQMALQMTSEYETNQSQGFTSDGNYDVSVTETKDTGKRSRRRGSGRQSKRARNNPEPPQPPQPTPVIAPMCDDSEFNLKFTYGVNAWKNWVTTKNLEIEVQRSEGNLKLKLFKTDILSCTADELNFALCLFLKEVRKPSGDTYAPDSIYYLCLGIQQYLYRNSRVENIFTDPYFEKFTEGLDDIISQFEVRLNTNGLLVCRIEEEHLWECRQLGAHSPHVLLNTLVYFNSKHFMLRTELEHVGLSFSHIMKHWKKSNNPTVRGINRSVYLRYYQPQHNLTAKERKKKEDLPVLEQAENTDNPLRCPVKLYEFYLSKCPESIKNRNDVFYLVPESSCVPDSPVWYSTAKLGTEQMGKMLHRTRLVREIQELYLHQSYEGSI